MSLVYNIDSCLNLTNINAQLNAEEERPVATNKVELAFAGVGNFLSGDFKQLGSSINDIKSNVFVSGNLNKARLFLLTNIPDGMNSLYGAQLKAAGYETKYGTASISLHDSGDSPITASSVVPSGSEAGSIIPLTEQTFIGAGANEWEYNQGSFGEGLVTAVGAALFKKVGKNAALLNDTDMISDINNSIQGVLGAAMNETTNNYDESHYFKRYLASGRYASQTDGDINHVNSYDMNDTVVKMKIKMSGIVSDTGNGTGSTAVDLTDPDTVNQVFAGTTSNNPNPEATIPHLVNSHGNYNIHVYLELRHDERF